MNNKKYNWILYLITLTIITTIAVQLYWNYKNYEQNKQRVVNEIQQSLNDAIRDYFLNVSKEKFIAVVNPEKKLKIDGFNFGKKFLPKLYDSIKINGKDDPEFSITSIALSANSSKEYKSLDSVVENVIKDISALKKSQNITSITEKAFSGNSKINKVQVFKGKKAIDSLKLLKEIGAMYISVKNESLDVLTLDTLLHNSLHSKKIHIPFHIKYFKSDTLFNKTDLKHIPKAVLLEKDAVSSFLKEDERVNLSFYNPTKEALKRSLIGILLSLLLSLAIISSLFYLLKVINQQKELAEIKNDLISNITHEFKTPITTVSTALEAINNFNVINDTEKTKNYIAISSLQIKKLNTMVEKLLETATLDSEKLLLKKETLNIVDLIENLTKKHQFTTNNKELKFISNSPEIHIKIDTFHFENAISNLIDNAIKYGGNIIEIHLQQVLNTVEIIIADNGKGIEKNQQEKIFDKFYRIPKGNTHDVKGFGIGLYYTKKIIEKHNGKITVASKPNNTTFKIVLNNE